MTRTSATHRCTVGFDFQPKKAGSEPLRFEPGDLVKGVPPKVLKAHEGIAVEPIEASGDE